MVIESDADALGSAAVIFSPALTRRLESRFATGTETELQVVGGAANVPGVLSQLYRLDSVAKSFPEMLTSAFVPAAEDAISPEAVALAVFGAVAGLSALLIAGLILARLLRSLSSESATLRAVGANRAVLLGDQLTGVLGAIVLGSLLAIAVAVGLSPLTPLGPVRPIYPGGGLGFDWTVLGFGFLVLTVFLASAALAFAIREIRRTTASRSIEVERREPRWLNSLTQGLPISVGTGLRFALGSGRGPNKSPVRSAIFGSVLAVIVLVATLTFGSSLNGLAASPPLFGWNWNYAMLSGFAGQEDLPAPLIAKLLSHDPFVRVWSGVNFTKGQLGGQLMPMLAQSPGARVSVPLLSGHGLESSDEVVLGPSTLQQLGKRLGETVSFSASPGVTRTLMIVGTATMPSVTNSGGGMGVGALVSTSLFPANLLNLQGSNIAGPNAELIRVKPGLNSTAAYRSLVRIDDEVNANPSSQGQAGGVVSVLRPIEIVNFRTMDSTPAILAAGLALGAIVALGLTISASVRRRRRDLALLKSLGFTQRQLALVIAWQATVAAVLGAVIGIPAGIFIGRQLWIVFATGIHAVPAPAVPIVSVVLVGVGALIFANAVAALPGRSAARTPTALVLRAE